MQFLRAEDYEPDPHPEALARRVETGLYAEHLLATGGHPNATDDELRAVAEDGRAALRRCVLTHLRFVAKLARERSHRTGQCRHELFQEGCLGLLEAVKRFDHARGVPFLAFAAHWIRSYQGRLMDDRRLSGQIGQRTRQRVLRTASDLTQRLARQVTIADLTAAGESRAYEVLSEPRVVSLQSAEWGPDVPDPVAGRRSPLGDLRTVMALLGQLDDLERRIIVMRYGLGSGPMLSGPRTAAELGLTPSKVRRIEHGALARMRAIGELAVA